MAENCNARRASWGELNPDLLRFVAKKLHDVTDFISFRAVCKEWRVATSYNDIPPQLPWLMSVNSGNNCEVLFHAIFTGKTFSFCFYGESVRDNNRKGSTKFLLDQFRGEFSFVTTTSSENYEKESYYETIFQIMFDRHGSNKSGHEFIPPAPKGNLSKFYDSVLSDEDIRKRLTVVVPNMKFFAHYKGMNFQYKCQGTSYMLEVTDDRSNEVLTTIPCPDEARVRNCLISSDNGLLLVLENHVPSRDGDVKYEYGFSVYRLENLFIKPYWTKLNGIGDMMLFLDYNNGFSLTASEYGVKGNCIYFNTCNLKKGSRLRRTKVSRKRKISPQSSTHPAPAVARFDFEENTTCMVFSLDGSDSYCSPTFFIPSLV